MKALFGLRTIKRAYEAGHLGICAQRHELVQVAQFDLAANRFVSIRTGKEGLGSGRA